MIIFLFCLFTCGSLNIESLFNLDFVKTDSKLLSLQDSQDQSVYDKYQIDLISDGFTVSKNNKIISTVHEPMIYSIKNIGDFIVVCSLDKKLACYKINTDNEVELQWQIKNDGIISAFISKKILFNDTDESIICFLDEYLMSFRLVNGEILFCHYVGKFDNYKLFSSSQFIVLIAKKNMIIVNNRKIVFKEYFFDLVDICVQNGTIVLITKTALYVTDIFKCINKLYCKKIEFSQGLLDFVFFDGEDICLIQNIYLWKCSGIPEYILSWMLANSAYLYFCRLDNLLDMEKFDDLYCLDLYEEVFWVESKDYIISSNGISSINEILST